MNTCLSSQGEKPPLISIITVFYNRSEFVKHSIDSLLCQTLQDFELIIIDDGSNDETPHYLNSYHDPRIKLILKDNSGFTNCLIEAINLARGEFIAIHGSGDISLPTRLEREYELLISSPDIGVVGCWVENIQPDGSKRRRDLVDTSRSFGQLLQEQCIFTHGEVMYRRSAYDKAGGYREFFKFSQDYDLWFRMSESHTFAIVPEVLYHRFSPPNTIRADPEKMLVQLQLSELARQSALRRQNGGRDIVEEFGSFAFSHMEKSKSLGNTLVGIGAHMVTRSNNIHGNILIEAGIIQAPTLKNKLQKIVADHYDSRSIKLLIPLLALRRAARNWKKKFEQRRRSMSA